jgi:molybdate/tungstate transport system substrate-binding protein
VTEPRSFHAPQHTARRRAALTLAGVAGVALVAAGCGSSSKAAAPATTVPPAATTAPATTAPVATTPVATAPVATTPATTAAPARHSGNVDVFSAGSLDTLMTKSVGPAFHAATGYTLVDTSHGSSALAADIKDKTAVADVFVSASPAVDTTLEGAKNGAWVSWYGAFATSPEVLGYYPKSKFAKDLQTMPWYKVITLPGFRLGRTDPTQDPGGVLAVKALEETAAAKGLPALTKLATETSDVYEEDTEQAGIQTGQIDASFMYEADANSQGSPFVPLTGVNLAGDYTITIVKGAPHEAAAEAFVRFLLGPTGQAEMKADHFGVVAPATLSGSGVPSDLTSLFTS